MISRMQGNAQNSLEVYEVISMINMIVAIGKKIEKLVEVMSF